MFTLPVTAVLLHWASITQCVPSFIENDSIVFPDNITSPAVSGSSSKMKECIEENMKIEFNGECRSLLTTEGACPDNQWLVLDIASASQTVPKIQGKCVLRRCPPSLHYWFRENRCVHSNQSATLCLRGNRIKTDMFGDGYCECINEPVHARGQSGECFPVYSKEPCTWNKVWTWTGRWAECREDNCAQDRVKAPNKTVTPWANGQCYSLNDRGPCGQGKVVKLDPDTFTARCEEPLATLNLFTAPCTGTDHAHSCAPPVKHSQANFLSQVATQLNNKRNSKKSKAR